MSNSTKIRSHNWIFKNGSKTDNFWLPQEADPNSSIYKCKDCGYELYGGANAPTVYLNQYRNIMSCEEVTIENILK